ncbi:MAG: tRNA dihydrouridine synthase, partial [Thermoplasmatota archaeon]
MTDLLRPLVIGNVRAENNLVLSPMAGYSDLPLRALARKHGAGLVCTEMVSAGSVARRVPRTLAKMRTEEAERPVSIQVFGSTVESVADAARAVEASCDVVGFNLGCPAFQVQKQGCGAALLDKPELAAALVASLDAATRKPLLVKMRLGNGARADFVSLARALEHAGADALIVHGRTARQGYSGRADWPSVGEIKRALAIPVIVNGDVVDGPTAAAALAESGADGVALGRAALGNPRVFKQVIDYLCDGTISPPPTLDERVTDLAEYVAMATS